MEIENFVNEYNRLNPRQKEAVDTIYGPVMVIAGPGTGKTQTLTVRIANILQKTDSMPSSILCLTFTNSGVKAMRERLVKIIGPDAYRIDIHTFHSFCNEVITFHPERFLFAKKMQQITDLEQIQYVMKILNEGDFKLLRPPKAADFYLKSIIKAIGDLKMEGLTPEEYEKIVRQRHQEYEIFLAEREKKPTQKDLSEKTSIERNLELSDLYRKYQELMRENGRYDYNDMILFVLNEFKKDINFLAGYQEKYLFILVDEYQDTNGAQNELIKLMGAKVDQPNIMVVGDDEQSIYRFQGASLENLLFFTDLFPKTKKIVLNINYRSPKNLVAAARSMIVQAGVNAQQVLAIDKEIEAANQNDVPGAWLVKLESDDLEQSWIMEKIKKLSQSGVDLSDIALIFRTNDEMEDYKKLFLAAGIDWRFLTGANILQEKIISQLVDLIRVIINPFNDELLFKVMYFSWLKIDEVDHYRLLSFGRRKIFAWLVENKDADLTDKFKDWPGLVKFANFVLIIRKENANRTLPDVLEKLIKQSGLLKWVVEDKKRVGDLPKLKSFFKFAKSAAANRVEYDLSEFINTLADMKDHDLPIRFNEMDFSKSAVVLTTAHGSKGLEFDYVFIVKAVDKHWSNKTARELIKIVPGVIKKQPEKTEAVDEERRLFYVAMTRAKKELYITWAKKYGLGKDEKETIESMFVAEIDQNFSQSVDSGLSEQKNKELIADYFDKKPEAVFSVELTDYLRHLVDEFVLSPTALNKYLDCPRKFLYESLLRVPMAKKLPLQYGSAIHYALEMFYSEYKKTKQLPEKEVLLQYFEAGLNKEVLAEHDLKHLRQNGRENLAKYYDFYCDKFKIPIYNEFNFGSKKILLDQQIPITGKVDRVELLEDSDGETVRVIDYKTGQPKSRNDILGKTKTSTGDYHRQLIFYKLLGRLSSSFIYKIKEVELDFVEPKKGSGKFVRESFMIELEQLNQLKKMIREVWVKIQALQFPCLPEKNKCKDCDYRDLCDK
ncbi:MAG: ATP-dependent DNA helicase [Patescibacteria group bacterium]